MTPNEPVTPNEAVTPNEPVTPNEAVIPNERGARRRRLAWGRWAAALVVVLGAAACGGDAPEGYSDEVREAFMKGCVEDGENADLVEVCACAYESAVEDLSFEQFKAAELRLQDGSPEVSDDVVDIIVGCIREVSASR